jgi:hypothetical protein
VGRKVSCSVGVLVGRIVGVSEGVGEAVGVFVSCAVGWTPAVALGVTVETSVTAEVA